MAALDKWKAQQRCKSLAILISLTNFSRMVTSFLPFLLYTCVNALRVFHFIIQRPSQATDTSVAPPSSRAPCWLAQISGHKLLQGISFSAQKISSKDFFPQMEIVLATTSAQQLYQSFGPLIKRTRIISFKDLTCILKYLKVNLKKKK